MARISTLQRAGGPELPAQRPYLNGDGSKRSWRLPGFITREPWPLLIILALQSALSMRLIWSNTAFGDEALYLWAGHLEWAHWLHGEPIPDFASYFSGAPVVYPPIGA